MLDFPQAVQLALHVELLVGDRQAVEPGVVCLHPEDPLPGRLAPLVQSLTGLETPGVTALQAEVLPETVPVGDELQDVRHLDDLGPVRNRGGDLGDVEGFDQTLQVFPVLLHGLGLGQRLGVDNELVEASLVHSGDDGPTLEVGERVLLSHIVESEDKASHFLHQTDQLILDFPWMLVNAEHQPVVGRGVDEDDIREIPQNLGPV